LLAGGLWEYRYITARDEPASGTTQTAKPTATPSTPTIFADTFADNTNAWNLQSTQGQFSVTVGGGNLSLEDDNNMLLWELLPGGRVYDNFRLVVDAKLAKGNQNNGYGVYFRGKSNQNSDMATYYRFELYGDGSYALFKGTIDGAGKTGSIKLLGYVVDPAIQKQGGTNHIVIVAVGPTLTLSVNNQTLKTITDTSYADGTIALFVSNLEGSPPGAQVLFSKLAIYQA
jgi:3-keto-disaccharide hydrolase